jgi:hypothetical protein
MTTEEEPMSAFITIDTDNAIVRFYAGNAEANGLKADGRKRLLKDVQTMVQGMTYATGITWTVQVVL